MTEGRDTGDVTEDLKGNLVMVLRREMDLGEVTRQAAINVYAELFGVQEAMETFGPDLKTL